MTVDHQLIRAMYAADGSRRDARDIEFLMLPLPLRRLLVRASRLARLTEMAAPAAILEQERRLVAESALAFNGYVTGRVLEPARVAGQAQHDEATRSSVAAHLAARHGVAVDATATAAVVCELHGALHGADDLDHEDYDFDETEGGET